MCTITLIILKLFCFFVIFLGTFQATFLYFSTSRKPMAKMFMLCDYKMLYFMLMCSKLLWLRVVCQMFSALFTW